MLKKETTLDIEAKALEVLSNLDSNIEDIKLPVDILKLLEIYNLKLKAGDFKDKAISGAYDKNANVIYVAENDPVTRKAFTIAHELGHYILHKDKESEYFYRKNLLSLGTEEKEDEAEANWFAASLLMPTNLIKKYWERTHDLEELGVIFGVSPTAVYFRLKYLGLING